VVQTTPDITTFSLHSAADGSRVWSEQLDADAGTYATPPIAPGQYFLAVANFEACQVYSGFFCPGGNTITAGTPITVTAGLIASGIDFVLDGDQLFRSNFGN
ncbi:MAG TPA: hypothetical protein VLF18_10230, partial [Tahibacter sp.]|uniref:hypothetical protein n=1 Tax=Tahibacter sp. TaxID=2056211 RepID=UPI002C19E083